MADERDLRTSYDLVAGEYGRRIFDELRHKPLDREVLEGFADRVRGRGAVCDLGCGPGQVARFLHDLGADVVGIDLSPGMVEEARRRSPKVPFRQGDMTALDVPDGTFAGIAAFYSIIHVPRAQVEPALRELRRVLRPGGLLLLAFHLGTVTLHLDEWWERKVSIDFHFFTTAEILAGLGAAGFEIDEVREREPYPDVEHPSRRAYVLARKPIGP
jgi:SAM-dependent methyltransferase